MVDPLGVVNAIPPFRGPRSAWRRSVVRPMPSSSAACPMGYLPSGATFGGSLTMVSGCSCDGDGVCFGCAGTPCGETFGTPLEVDTRAQGCDVGCALSGPFVGVAHLHLSQDGHCWLFGCGCCRFHVVYLWVCL